MFRTNLHYQKTATYVPTINALLLLFEIYVHLLVSYDTSFYIWSVRSGRLFCAVGSLFLWASFVFRFFTIIKTQNIAIWFEATENRYLFPRRNIWDISLR